MKAAARSRIAAFTLPAMLLATLLAVGCDEAANEDRARKVAYNVAAVAYTAERRFTYDDGNGNTIEWLERVKSMGDGRMSVELLTRNGKIRSAITDPDELAAFDRLTAQLATGGGARAMFQRDATPDDLDRMAMNYWITVVDLSRKPITPRGEPALTYLIEPIAADRPHYVLVASTRADREGFPLGCDEYVTEADGTSRLVSRMEVTNLQWGAPTDFTPNPEPIQQRTTLGSLDVARRHAAAVGVTLLLPQDDALPPGFQLVTAEEVVIRSTANAAGTEQDQTLWRFVYSDGIEHIDFIEHAPLETLPSQFTQSDLYDTAFVSRFATISSASLLHQKTQVTIETRLASDRFDALLKALVPL